MKITDRDIDNIPIKGSKTFEIEKNDLIFVISFLQEKGFQQLIDIFAVDYPERAARHEVVYLLLDIQSNKRVAIKLALAEEDGIPTLIEIFSTAGWLEREIYDMHGITFINHPDLRRILTDYGFEGHPLRKDFPLSGYKEVRYDVEKKEVVYGPVNLTQEYRNFDFLSPWEGTEYNKD